MAQYCIYSGAIANQELARRPSKIVDEFKKHDTANHLVQYDCKGLASVNLYCINGVEVKN